jgi:hypothetical protein
LEGVVVTDKKWLRRLVAAIRQRDTRNGSLNWGVPSPDWQNFTSEGLEAALCEISLITVEKNPGPRVIPECCPNEKEVGWIQGEVVSTTRSDSRRNKNVRVRGAVRLVCRICKVDLQPNPKNPRYGRHPAAISNDYPEDHPLFGFPIPPDSDSADEACDAKAPPVWPSSLPPAAVAPAILNPACQSPPPLPVRVRDLVVPKTPEPRENDPFAVVIDMEGLLVANSGPPATAPPVEPASTEVKPPSTSLKVSKVEVFKPVQATRRPAPTPASAVAVSPLGAATKGVGKPVQSTQSTGPVAVVPAPTIVEPLPKKALSGQVFGKRVHRKMVAKAFDISIDLCEKLWKEGLLQLCHTVETVPYVCDNRIIGNQAVKIVEKDYHLVRINASLPRSALQPFGRSGILLASLCSAIALLLPTLILKNRPLSVPVTFTMLSLLSTMALMTYIYRLLTRKQGRKNVSLVYAPHIATSVLCEYQRRTPALAIASSIHMKMLRMAAFPLSDADHLSVKDGTELCVLSAIEERYFRTGLAPSSTKCQ